MENKTDIIVHTRRVCQELIFQRMIKEPCLKDCTVEELNDLAYNLYIVISNYFYNEETKKRLELITDDIANNRNFITGILQMHIFGKKQN